MSVCSDAHGHFKFYVINKLSKLYISRSDNLQRFWMLFYKRLNVANTLLFQDLVNGNQDTRFFNISKFIVDCSTENTHGRRQSHISIHQWRNVETKLTNLGIQDTIIIFKIVTIE